MGGKVEISASVVINAPPERVYASLANWTSQGTWIPFTFVEVVEGDGGVGSIVEAVSAIGWVRVVDVMRVMSLEPPYKITVMHCGEPFTGPGVFDCTRLPGERTRLRWAEQLELAGGRGRILGSAVLRPVLRLGLKYAMLRLARRLSGAR